MNKTKKILLLVSIITALALTGCTISSNNNAKQEVVQSKAILESYSNMALDSYTNALNDAKTLSNVIKEFASNPTESTFEKAKNVWLISRESYGQTEAFRLSNGPIDAEDGWVNETYGAVEGQINAWPLDENMIDYTIDANGNKTSGNIIDTVGKFNPSGEDSKVVDVTKITPEAISALNEDGGDANVASGYHAIEFLLWGQDQDYSNFIKDSITNGAMTAGQRPLSDFTSDVNAPRRLEYLKAASQKIVNDLTIVTSAWEKDLKGTQGLYRAALLGQIHGDNSSKNISKNDALKQIISGLGVFIKSELANERIAVAVLTPSEEDEHSCFSDNTHRDIAVDYQGFKNVLTATYNGKKYGPALLDKVDSKSKAKIEKLMTSIEEKIDLIDQTAKTKEHFDYQIKPTSPMSKVIVKLKNQMRKLGDMMVIVATANGINLTKDDVTDADETKI